MDTKLEKTLIEHIHLGVCASTQTYLKKYLQLHMGIKGPVLISAGKQLAGRGRRGHQWIQFPGSLAFSFLWRPMNPIGLTSLEVGVLLVEFFQTLGQKLQLKWPNDLILKEKGVDSPAKVGGLLCEYISPQAVLVGLGLNILPPENIDLPREDIQSLPYPISFFEPFAGYDLQSLPYAIYHFMLQQSHLNDAAQIRKRWSKYCCHDQQAVTLKDEGGKAFHGIFQGLGNAGEARILAHGGTQAKEFLAGSLFFDERRGNFT